MAVLTTLNAPLALLGALLIAYAWLEVLDRRGRAVGTIIGITTRYGVEGDEITVPEVAFTVDDVPYSFLPTMSVAPEAKKRGIGVTVPVAYNPDNPDDADVVSPLGLYLPTGVATLFYALWVCWCVAQRL
jgi:hypothetical protein